MRIEQSTALAAALAVAAPLAVAGPAVEGLVSGAAADVFGGYSYVDPLDLPWRRRADVSVLAAVGSDATGRQVVPCASVWVPLGRTAFVGFGAGFTWSGDSFARRGAGAGPVPAATSALPARASGTGLRQLHAGPAIVVRLGPEWFAGGGAFLQRSTEETAGHPIEPQGRDRNGWSIGVGVAHAWR
jgi:hypothetical protein